MVPPARVSPLTVALPRVDLIVTSRPPPAVTSLPSVMVGAVRLTLPLEEFISPAIDRAFDELKLMSSDERIAFPTIVKSSSDLMEIGPLLAATASI